MYVRERAGNALQLLSAEEKPVRCQGSQEEGSRHISIFISFSGTFTDLLLVSLLYRVCYGSLVFASCLLTTLAALMVVCGKISAVSSLSCACVSHSSGSGADSWCRPGIVQCKRKGRLRPTLVFVAIHIIPSWLDSHKVYCRLLWTKSFWWKCHCDVLSLCIHSCDWINWYSILRNFFYSLKWAAFRGPQFTIIQGLILDWVSVLSLCKLRAFCWLGHKIVLLGFGFPARDQGCSILSPCGECVFNLSFTHSPSCF